MDKLIKNYNVVTIAANGLGYGSGTISVQDRLANANDGLNTDILAEAERTVAQDAPMLAIASDDSDGCPDGRGTKRVIRGTEELEDVVVRPKVFGGGLTMGAAGRVGLGFAEDQTIADVFDSSQAMFNALQRDYGAHSADQAHGNNCGCGAIDAAPQIWAKSIEFKDDITSTILAVAGSTAESTGLADRVSRVYEKVEAFQAQQSDDVEYSGRTIMEEIANNGKIIAELTDEHKEVRIVVNTDIKDATFDQEAVRRNTNAEAQVFTVDVPRMRSIAAMFDTPDERADAFVSMMIYSFATAATLTKGDLPVDFVYNTHAEISFDPSEF